MVVLHVFKPRYSVLVLFHVLFCCSTHQVLGANEVKAAAGEEHFELTKAAQKLQVARHAQWDDFTKKGEITATPHKAKSGNEFTMFKFKGENVREMRVKEIFQVLQNWLVVETENKQRFFEMDIGGKPFRFRFQKKFSHGKPSNIVLLTEGGQALTYEQYYKMVNSAGLSQQEMAKWTLKAAREPMNAQTPWPEEYETTMVSYPGTNLEYTLGNVLREIMVLTQAIESVRPTDESFNNMQAVIDKATDLRSDNEEKYWDEKIENVLGDKTNKLTQLDIDAIKKMLMEIPLDDVFKKIVREARVGKEAGNDFSESLSIPPKGRDKIELEKFNKVLFEAAKEAIKRSDPRETWKAEKEAGPKEMKSLLEEIENKFFKKKNYVVDDEVVLRNFIDFNLDLPTGVTEDKLVRRVKEMVDVIHDKETNEWNQEIEDFINKNSKSMTSLSISEAYLKNKWLENHNPLLEAATDAVKYEEKREEFSSKLGPTFSNNLKLKLFDAAIDAMLKAWKEFSADYGTEIGKYKPRNGRIPGADIAVRSIIKLVATGRFETFEKAFKALFVLQAKHGGTNLGRRDLGDSKTLERRYSISEDMDVDEETSGGATSGKRKATDEGDGGKAKALKTDPTDADTVKSRSVAVEDRKQVERVLEESFKNSEFDVMKGYKIVDKSIAWENDRLKFKLKKGTAPEVQHEVRLDPAQIKGESYIRNRVLDHMTYYERPTAVTVVQYYNKTLNWKKIDTFALKESVTSGVGKAVGGYGAAVGIFTTAHYLEEGDYGQAAFSAFQSGHAIGGLTGMNEELSKLTKNLLRKGANAALAELGFEYTVEEFAKIGAEALGETASKVVGRILGDIPFVGLAFDIYFITEDIKALADKNDKTPEFLKVAHFVLDIETTALSIAETAAPELSPILEPLIIALTIVRISIDSFYNDIKAELAKVKGKGFGQHVKAVLLGLGEGVTDTLTLGLYTQLNAIKEQLKFERDLFRNLSNPENYFKVMYEGDNSQTSGRLDFTAGEDSFFGGFLTVRLNEDGSFKVTVAESRFESGGTSRTFSVVHPVNDIVLGVGQVQNPKYQTQEAKLWLLITVETKDVISGFENHTTSRYGTYYGNSNNNSFYALQGNHSVTHDALTEYLKGYHYDIYGEGGNDRFYLGPQTSRVTGGEGSDMYIIPEDGGRVIINNFAFDERMDILHINIPHDQIRCARHGWHLAITHSQENNIHTVFVENWFAHDKGEFYRHMFLHSRDGVMIDVTSSSIDPTEETYQVECKAVSIDLSAEETAQTVKLIESLSEVKQVTGSKYVDDIIGNDKPNAFNGGPGEDYIKGGGGADVYFVDRNEGPDLIENSAADEEEDTIIIGVPYDEIMLQVSRWSNLDMIDTTNQKTLLTIIRWMSGSLFQHVAFLSSDQIRFVVDMGSDGQTPLKKPLSIDLSTYDFGVRLDLENPGISNVHTSLRDSISERIQVVVDSPYDDDLKGNALDNILTCTKGSDQLQGGGGRDTYLIEKDCNSVTIRNFHTDGEMDLMLLSCLHHTVKLSVNHGESHLNIDCRTEANKAVSVTLVDWFVSEEHRHLAFKTKDKIVAIAPEALTDPLVFYPIQIEIGESCPGSLHVHFHLDNDVKYSKCERFVVKTEKCSFSIFGNSISNYLNPGPGNPHGTQLLKGKDGSDTYVMGHKYGEFNTIDNYAKDDELDHLKFDVLFHDTEILKDADNLVIRSRSIKDSVSVSILKFCTGPDYQHLLVHSVDGILFLLDCRYPYFKIFIVDFSSSIFSQVISASEDSNSVYSYDSAAIILGSKKAQNHIRGSKNTRRLVGGQSDDTIIGGSGDEELLGKNGNDHLYGGIGNDALYGGEGDDYLEGGEGHDVLFGGLGADTIIGGSGLNTIIFSGYDNTGVTVNLYSGQGIGADAEGDTYKNISNIYGSEYDDFLVGNDKDNLIKGFAGEDYIIPEGGHDILEGGTGSDIYDLTNAYGFKTISNFDPNEDLDLILMSKTTSESICYFFYEKDLMINVNYNSLNSSTDSVRRIYLDEGFMVITIADMLINSTFQHLALHFSDKFLYPTDFVEFRRQMGPLINAIRNPATTILNAEVQHNGDITLTITPGDNFYNIILPSSTSVELFYVHVSQDSTEYTELNMPFPSTPPISLSSLTPGSQHSFFLILKSCELTLAISEPVSLVIPPLPPLDLIVEPFFDGFKMSWTNSNLPSLLDISYKIVIRSEEVTNSEPVTKFTNENTFLIFSLIPNTEYHITVTTVSFDTESTTSIEVVKRTSSHSCGNFENLPENLFITDIETNSQSQLVAHLDCNIAYSIQGSDTVICNSVQSLPQCILKTCAIETPVSSAYITTGQSGNARHGELVTWHCNHGYGVDGSKDETFSSTCLDGDWIPDIRTCSDILTCPHLSPPSHGTISSTEVVHVGESVTYSCPEDYEIGGPTERSCIMNSNKGAYWAPNEEVTCTFFACPSLIHQTDGRYIDTTYFKPIANAEDATYVRGDSIILECYHRYFPGPDHITGTGQYNRIKLACDGHQWIPEQRECQHLVTLETQTDYLEFADITVSYGYSGPDRLETQNTLMEDACILAAGTVSYEVKSTDYTSLKCIRASGTYKFQHSSNSYSGLPTIVMEGGHPQGLCIGDSAPDQVVQKFCELAGFGSQYTSSEYTVYSNNNPTTSYRISRDYRIERITETACDKRIKCKMTCDTPSTTGITAHCPTERPLAEGDICEFSCDVGSRLIGSYTRECTNTGWTGNTPYCDAEMWKIEVENIVRYSSSGMPHQLLANHIRDSISNMFPGMQFIVLVYDELYGGDNHQFYSSYQTDVTYLWRLNGHNVIVQRLKNNPSPPIEADFPSIFRDYLEYAGCNPFRTKSSNAEVCSGYVYNRWTHEFGPVFVHVAESNVEVRFNLADQGSRFYHLPLPLIKYIFNIIPKPPVCCASATLLQL